MAIRREIREQPKKQENTISFEEGMKKVADEPQESSEGKRQNKKVPDKEEQALRGANPNKVNEE